MAQPFFAAWPWLLTLGVSCWCAALCSAEPPRGSAEANLDWLDGQIELVQRAIHEHLSSTGAPVLKRLDYPQTSSAQAGSLTLERITSRGQSFPEQLASRLNDLLAERGRLLGCLAPPTPSAPAEGVDLVQSDRSVGRSWAGGLLGLSLVTALLLEVRRRIGEGRGAVGLDDSKLSLIAGAPVRSVVA